MQVSQPLDRASAAPRNRGWSVPDSILPHLLLWPAMAALILVFAYPLAYSFWISLHAYNITRPPRFIGLDNYALILEDGRVWEAFGTSVIFAATSLVLQFVIGFGIAILL